jgi:hypothetical protein
MLQALRTLLMALRTLLQVLRMLLQVLRMLQGHRTAAGGRTLPEAAVVAGAEAAVACVCDSRQPQGRTKLALPSLPPMARPLPT